MNPQTTEGASDAFLSGAYDRIRRATPALSVAAAMVTTARFGWHSGLGLILGASVAYINFVWLHRGSELMIDRMIAPADSRAAKPGMARAFILRYLFVLASVYVILKSFPGIVLFFSIGLFMPILAAMCEGVFEAIAGSRKHKSLE
jgi:ATP synthase I chain